MHAPALVVQHSATCRHPELGQEPRGPRHRDEVTGRERRAYEIVQASSGCEGAKNESGRKPSKPSPHWAGFLSAAVFWRRVLSRTSALSSSVSLEVSMARLGSATSSRTTVTRR